VKTIQEGVNNATAGDTVYVYNGTYYEHVTVDKQVDLVGENRENVIVNGSGTGKVFYITTPVNKVNIDTFTITNGQYGIYFYKSSYNDIINCNVYSNKNNGIYSHQSLYSNIINCNVYNNNGYGIFLYYSVHNKLEDNTIYDNAYNFGVDGWSDASDISQYEHNIGPSNTINGKRIYYLVEQENIILDENYNFGYLGLISCTNITAKNAEVGGVLIVNTTDSTISNVSSHNNKLNGIVLRTSSGNNVINCNAYDNYYGHGIQLYFSPDNNIMNCDSYLSLIHISEPTRPY